MAFSWKREPKHGETGTEKGRDEGQVEIQLGLGGRGSGGELDQFLVCPGREQATKEEFNGLRQNSSSNHPQVPVILCPRLLWQHLGTRQSLSWWGMQTLRVDCTSTPVRSCSALLPEEFHAFSGNAALLCPAIGASLTWSK